MKFLVCLVQWMERKKDCPQCRSKCTERSIFRIYFNNLPSLDTSQVNSANLIETIDNLTLQVREKDLKLKRIEQEKSDIETSLNKKEKQIKKLDAQSAQQNQIIATMKHEIDLLSTSRASYKIIENENAELKSRLELMQSVESVLSASQKEVDEVLKQNLSNKDLSVMVGTLRRELHANEIRKHELRKQLQNVKNDLRMEQEEKRKLQEKLSFYESENHTLKNRMRKFDSIDEDPVDLTDTPDFKKPRLALLKIDDQNTPSPLSRSEFEGRIKQIEESDSPYLKVKSSSVGLAMLKKPLVNKDNKSAQLKSLSIFQKPRVNFDNVKKSENLVFNGVGGTSKVLQSDLILKPPTISLPKKPFKKNLSASALGK